MSEELNKVDEQAISNCSPKKQSTSRTKFSEEEEQELQELFKKYIDKKRRPLPHIVRKKMNKSKKCGGLIHKRTISSVKNKIFRIIDNLWNISEDVFFHLHTSSIVIPKSSWVWNDLYFSSALISMYLVQALCFCITFWIIPLWFLWLLCVYRTDCVSADFSLL